MSVVALQPPRIDDVGRILMLDRKQSRVEMFDR